MAAEPDLPKTGTIAYVTILSLILILVSFLALQPLYFIWEARYENKLGEGRMPSDLAVYRAEQNEKLKDLPQSQAGVLASAKEGKDLSIKVPVPAKTETPTKTSGTPGKTN